MKTTGSETLDNFYNYINQFSGKISLNDAMNIEEVTDITNLNIQIPEEKSGIELLEELANSHCEECGCEKEDPREKFCNDCLSEFHRQDLREQANREEDL